MNGLSREASTELVDLGLRGRQAQENLTRLQAGPQHVSNSVTEISVSPAAQQPVADLLSANQQDRVQCHIAANRNRNHLRYAFYKKLKAEWQARILICVQSHLNAQGGMSHQQTSLYLIDGLEYRFDGPGDLATYAEQKACMQQRVMATFNQALVLEAEEPKPPAYHL